MTFNTSRIVVVKLPFDNAQNPCFLKQILFVGTGVSCSVPDITCLMTSLSKKPSCSVCLDAISPLSKNRRNNTSIMLRYSFDSRNTQNSLKNILVDCGKTFYDSTLRTIIPAFITQQVKHFQEFALEAVILSHAHADAFYGLDDLRHWTINSQIQSHIDVYVDNISFPTISATFPYLVDKALATGGGFVSSTHFHVFQHSVNSTLAFSTADPSNPFLINPIPGYFTVLNLLVYHGSYSSAENGNVPYMSLGFWFESVVYISDVSGFPEESLDFLKSKKISVLIIDSLLPTGSYSSHFCFDQVLDLVTILLPKSVYLVGTSHLWDYNESSEFFNSHPRIKDNALLSNVRFSMAFDGLLLEFE